ncbi:MAG: ArsR/SmtB family transcription factor [Vicinamibacterales bacterium]
MSHQKTLHALADDTRREIFDHLRARSASVGELADKMPVSRPAVSQHLKVLREAGLVREQRRGVQRIYRVDARGLLELRRYVDALWTDLVERFDQDTSDTPHEGRPRTARPRRRSR